VNYFLYENLEDAHYAPTVFQAAKKKEGAGKGGTDLDIELREFLVAMVRLGTIVFCREPSLAASTKRLIEEHLRPFALLSEGADAISEALGSTDVQELLNTVRGGVLIPLFERYAAGDSHGMNKKKEGKLTMSQAEFMQFLTDGNLIDKKLTGRECKALFIRVNLDDELGQATNIDADGNIFVEEGESGVASSAVMEYDEFEEVIVRIANEKQGMKGEDAKGKSKKKEKKAEATDDGSGWQGTEKQLGEMVVAFVKSLVWMVAAPPSK
jgi:hypothetical protein